LISLGHRRIAFVQGPAELYTSDERLAGFADAMAAAGLADDLRFDGGFDFEAGVAAGRRLLACRPLPEAVVAANDEAAIGVLTAFRHADVDVPGQVSVAGIDDTRPARFVELTTVNLPLYDLGAVAARHILAGPEEPGDDVVLPHRLVPRRTTARRASVS
ncbi:MAG TPA: substrate-binding domain-containing protein, partial [Solirubrobacteraceae bacterium]|nr:substrate-binding domain-containing protein [Solirubrobacteraceae bacterium]